MEALKKVDGTLFLTADHGNCEVMTDPFTGNPHTSHALNPVLPSCLMDLKINRYPVERLSDIAPTILKLMV